MEDPCRGRGRGVRRQLHGTRRRSELPRPGETYTITVEPWSTATATTSPPCGRRRRLFRRSRRLWFHSAHLARVHRRRRWTGRARHRRDRRHQRCSPTTRSSTRTNFDYSGDPDLPVVDPTTGELTPSAETYLNSRGSDPKPEGTPAVHAEDAGATPRYTNDTNGAFESVATEDPTHERVLRQQVGPGMAGGAYGGDPKTTIGDFRWRTTGCPSTPASATPAARTRPSVPANRAAPRTVRTSPLPSSRINAAGTSTFMRYGSTVASGATAARPATTRPAGNAWNNLAVQVAGTVYTAYGNGVEIASYTDPTPRPLASSARFRVHVHAVRQPHGRAGRPGYSPFYATVIDGMHQIAAEQVRAGAAVEPAVDPRDRPGHVRVAAHGIQQHGTRRPWPPSTGTGLATSAATTGTRAST